MGKSEPTHEDLAATEWAHIRNWCQQAILRGGDGLGAVMISYFDQNGVGTVPYVHPEYDSREASLWLLGAVLAHMDESTPEGTHPAEIADHALSLMDGYEGDELVGWSLSSDPRDHPGDTGGVGDGERETVRDGTLYFCQSCHQLFPDSESWMEHGNGPFADLMEAERAMTELEPGDEIPEDATVGFQKCTYP